MLNLPSTMTLTPESSANEILAAWWGAAQKINDAIRAAANEMPEGWVVIKNRVEPADAAIAQRNDFRLGELLGAGAARVGSAALSSAVAAWCSPLSIEITDEPSPKNLRRKTAIVDAVAQITI